MLQDEVWTEIVDKADPSRAVLEGESGGVVYTHLHRNSQPMIRFFSSDESHMTYEPCACGRTYPRLPDGVYGRLDDMLIIRGANVYPSQVQRSLLEVPGTGLAQRVRRKLKNETNVNFEVEILEQRAISKAKRVYDYRGQQAAPIAIQQLRL